MGLEGLMREYQEIARHRSWHLNTSIKGTQGLVTTKERKQRQVSYFFWASIASWRDTNLGVQGAEATPCHHVKSELSTSKAQDLFSPTKPAHLPAALWLHTHLFTHLVLRYLVCKTCLIPRLSCPRRAGQAPSSSKIQESLQTRLSTLN